MTQPLTPDGSGQDDRGRRQAQLVLALQIFVACVGLCAVAALLTQSESVGRIMVATLVLAPLVRVMWLGCRWLAKRDWRYAGVAFALLVIVASATLVH